MPPSFSPLLSALRYSPLPLLALSPLRTLFSLSGSTTPGQPSVSRYLLRQPFAGASRECPTPIVFVRAVGQSTIAGQAGGSADEGHWEDWAGMFAERGYTALEVDISAPVPAPDGAATPAAAAPAPSPLKAMSTLLAAQIRLLAIPFPPIVVSSGAASCDLAQMYVEDNPASGLVLINAADADADAGTRSSTLPAQASGVKEKRQVFTFEPNFPILLLGPARSQAALAQTRLGSAAAKGRGRGGKGVSIDELVDGSRGDKSRIVVERWMDGCGF